MTSSTPFYHCDDVTRLLSAFPWARLMRESSALGLLRHTLETSQQLQHILVQYPHVRYEPLDFVYVLLQAQGALDDELMADLCAHYGWQGVATAALLAALQPRAGFEAPLRAARQRVPHQQWLVDLALDELQGPATQELPELRKALQELRQLLGDIPRPLVTLRRTESSEVCRLRAEHVRAAYKKGGLDAARQALNA